MTLLRRPCHDVAGVFQHFRADLAAGIDDDCASDDVLKLPHISRPNGFSDEAFGSMI